MLEARSRTCVKCVIERAYLPGVYIVEQGCRIFYLVVWNIKEINNWATQADYILKKTHFIWLRKGKNSNINTTPAFLPLMDWVWMSGLTCALFSWTRPSTISAKIVCCQFKILLLYNIFLKKLSNPYTHWAGHWLI